MINKIQKNKVYPAKQRRNGGFVILFAVTLSAILLSIALGVTNIAFKEIKFGTSDKDTNVAFFAADVGAECALFYDRSDPAKNAFTGTATSITCAGNSFSTPAPSPSNFWTFILSGLGPQAQGCAKVTVDKTTGSGTQIISSGYNNGGNVSGSCTQGSNTVERQIELNY